MSDTMLTAVTVGGPFPSRRVRVDGRRHFVPGHGGAYYFVEDANGGPVYVWRQSKGRKPSNVKRRGVTFRIPESLLAEMEAYSAVSYKPKSHIVVEALEKYLKSKTK